jgi:hypothetical protein
MENGPNWKLVVKVLYKVKFDDIFYEASTHHINIASPITVGKLARALARLAPRMRGK